MSDPVVLVTGYPTSFIAARVVKKLLEEERGELRLVVQPAQVERAHRDVAALRADASRVRILEGDVASLDLGLSGDEFNALAAELTHIHHCAAVTYLGVTDEVAERGNVAGAREVLEIAEAAPALQRLVHWSTALVSGHRRGYVLEDELEAPSGFRNVIEQTRFRAERMIREAQAHLPITVLRAGIVVGDSVSGEIDRLEGPYLLVLLMLSAPPDLRLPMPGRGEVPLPIVPVDYLVSAGLHIAADPRSKGLTHHIVDPDPPTARELFEQIAEAAGRPLPRGFLPAGIASTLLRTPGLDRFAHVPRAFLEQLATEVVYDDRHTRDALAGSGLRCPPLESYVATMVDYVKSQQAEQRAEAAEAARAATDES